MPGRARRTGIQCRNRRSGPVQAAEVLAVNFFGRGHGNGRRIRPAEDEKRQLRRDGIRLGGVYPARKVLCRRFVGELRRRGPHQQIRQHLRPGNRRQFHVCFNKARADPLVAQDVTLLAAHGVNLNAVAPGAVATTIMEGSLPKTIVEHGYYLPMPTLTGKMGIMEPIEIAQALAFLVQRRQGLLRRRLVLRYGTETFLTWIRSIDAKNRQKRQNAL